MFPIRSGHLAILVSFWAAAICPGKLKYPPTPPPPPPPPPPPSKPTIWKMSYYLINVEFMNPVIAVERTGWARKVSGTMQNTNLPVLNSLLLIIISLGSCPKYIRYLLCLAESAKLNSNAGFDVSSASNQL